MKTTWQTEWFRLTVGIIVLLLALLIANRFSDRITQFIIATGLITYLAQAIINNFINRRFEAYKVELNNASQIQKMEIDKNFEAYKAQLNLNYFKKNRLHDERLKIVSDLYKLLQRLNSKAINMTMPFRIVYQDNNAEEQEEFRRIKETSDIFNEAKTFFYEHKIYFSPSISDQIEKILQEYHSIYWDYTNDKRFPLGKTKEEWEKKQAAFNRASKDIVPVFQKLEEEFRASLGVE
jgi:RNAse (barnase) inhibitor barstar